MSQEIELSRAAELLQRYPYNPDANIRKLRGAERLRAAEGNDLRALIAGIWARNANRWDHEEARAEAIERETMYDVPGVVGVPLEGPLRDRWDRLNTLLLSEWRTLSERLRETEAERLRDGRGPFAHGHESDVRDRFRKHLRSVYGQTDVDGAWSMWDDARMQQKGKERRAA